MRREWIRDFGDTLPRSAEHVAYPDHPLLVRGPDVLAGRAGVLTAFFLVSSGRTPMSDLASRILLCQLALPQNTGFVLVAEDERVKLDLFQGVVDAVDRGRHRKRTPLVGATPGTRDAVDNLRPFQFERFAEAWSITTRDPEVPRRQLRGTSTSGVFSQARSRRQSDQASAAAKALKPNTRERSESQRPRASRSRAEYVRAVSAIVRDAVITDYGLDIAPGVYAEVAALLAKGNAHLPLHDTFHDLEYVATKRADALKPARAAAFAGIVSTLPMLDE